MRRVGMAAGLILVLAGIVISGWQWAERRAYVALGESVVKETLAGAQGDLRDPARSMTVDWRALQEINPHTTAWVTIEGTDISLPVVSSSAEEPDFYLTHDLWGHLALEGTPFLDCRCTADGVHRLVYGHHLSTGGQFSSLQRTYEQETFDRLGVCRWCTPGGGETSFQPLCALCVDEWYDTVQRFDFSDDGALHAWLDDLGAGATARSSDYVRLIEGSRTVLTLVTCASDFANQPWRTLVVFVEVAYA